MQNRVKNAFDKVHADDMLKEKTKKSIQEKIYKKRNNSFIKIKYVYALCACFALCIIFTGQYLYFTPTTVVSIDINPSIELNVNRFDKVIDIKSYNDDGMNLANSLDILYENYEYAISQVIDDEIIQNYLENDEILSIAVIESDEEQGAEVLDYVKSCTENQKNMYCYGVNEEEASNAHSLGLSYGRYKYYEQIVEYDDKITPDMLNNMTMREIRDLLSSYEMTDYNTNYQTGTHQGNGNMYRGQNEKGKKNN